MLNDMSGRVSRNDMPRWIGLYRHMVAARRLEALAGDLARRGEVSFHLGGDGHEGSAVLALLLGPMDWLHPHYRDVALLLARGLSVTAYVHAMYGTALSPSRGRDMPPFQCDPALHILPMPTLVGNNALPAVGAAMELARAPDRPVVYCGLGDGGSQQGEVLEAIAEAARSRLPVLFMVENNRYALSTPTAGRTWYDLPDGPPRQFYGIPILRIDGRDPIAAHRDLQPLVETMRDDRRPRLVVFDCERLVDHSNSDDQTVYRSTAEIAQAQARDPIAALRRDLLASGAEEADLLAAEAAAAQDLEAAAAEARSTPAPVPASARRPLPDGADRRSRERRGAGTPSLSMLESIRSTLRSLLRDTPEVTLHGQDIEDPKGDVFGVTRGLSTAFPGRVINAPLAESTIVGTAIGRALVGGRPLVFLQFADFFPVAYNQLAAELGAIWWRTGGRSEVPVIVLAVCGGYRAGLGPYHAQSPEAPLAAMPGIDVVMPSTATDASGLLRAAFESRRPTVFLYPKALLNDRRRAAPPDVESHFAPIGRARRVRSGRDLTLVGWGNTAVLCEEAAMALARAGVETDVIDLRSLAPWDREMVVTSVRRTGRLIVAHEAPPFCGLGAEIMAAVAESADRPVEMARVTGPESLPPFHAGLHMQSLPSTRSILERAAAMLDLDLTWERPPADPPGCRSIAAAGASPSDENIRIVRLRVRPGDAVSAGAVVADVEADKAPHEIASPATGVIADVTVTEGQIVPAGTPIIRLRGVSETARPDTVPAETPVLRRRDRPAAAAPTRAPAAARTEPATVIVSTICHEMGSREVTNEELVRSYPGWSSSDVVQRTGIAKRYWIGPGENALTLAVAACRKLFDALDITLADITAIICSTGTPLSTTPSLACRLLRELNASGPLVEIQAHDINAACTGYLYALQQAWDMLQQTPEARVLLVTAETLSPMLDYSDPGTLFLFGDAATASLVSRERHAGGINLRVHRPVLSALGEEERVLFVPAMNSGEHIAMDGRRVFRVAVRKMIEMLERACAARGITIQDLHMIVPHQANERIIEAIQKAIKFPTEKVFFFIRDYGNTSSNTIPLALEALIPGRPAGEQIGLTAFGGGFTFGAAILDLLGPDAAP